MVITFRCRSSLDPTNDECSTLWELLTMSLLEMLKEGLVRESYINSFNLPFYFPHGDELRRIIEEDRSFSLDDMDTFEVSWDPHDIECNNRGKKTTKSIRVVTEPLFSSHFGNSINDMLFEKKLADHLATKKTRHLCVVISLIKKMNDHVETGMLVCNLSDTYVDFVIFFC
ncbi:putative jasmonate O-methyltransferase [Helianthus anomalus]